MKQYTALALALLFSTNTFGMEQHRIGNGGSENDNYPELRRPFPRYLEDLITMKHSENYSHDQNTKTQETQNSTSYVIVVDPYMKDQLYKIEYQSNEVIKALSSFLPRDQNTKTDIAHYMFDVDDKLKKITNNQKEIVSLLKKNNETQQMLSTILEKLNKNSDKTQQPITKKESQ